MDERLRDRRIWIAGGLLALVFLCLMACGLLAMASAALRPDPVVGVVPQLQPPAGQEEVTPPQVYYGPWGMGRPTGTGLLGFLFGSIGLLLKLLFLGLFLLLLIGLARHLFWGSRHWHPRTWGPHQRGKPPTDEEWKGRPHAWGPWAWHGYGGRWEAEGKPDSDEGETDTANPAYGGIE